MIILNVFEIIAPVFFLSLIGFLWVRMGFDYNVQFVTRLSMTLAVPCLIFVSLMKTNIAANFLLTVSAATIVAYLLVTILSLVAVKLLSLKVKTYLAPLIFGNTGNMGLPLAYFAFGEEGLGYAVVIFSIMVLYSFTFGIWIVSGGGAFLKIVKEPLVGATILGAVFLWQGWETPKYLTSTLDLIGQMAIPLMLITLGVAIGRLKSQNLPKAFLNVLVKFSICVLCAILSAYWFELQKVPFAVLLLQLSTPVAVTSYLLAAKYEADSESVASLVIVSTVFSAAYIPILLLFLI